MLLKEIFDSISKKMQSDFEDVTNLILHPVVKGTTRENALKQYLRPHIPDRFEFSEGIIIDSYEHQSKQIDIIIHDKTATPFLQDQDNAKVIPIESVYATIEVKSILTKAELIKCVENVKSVRELRKNTMTGSSSPTFGFVFAYDSDSSLQSLYENFIELSKTVSPEQQITCICILSKGLIFPVQKTNLSSIVSNPSMDTLFAMHMNSSNTLLIFYLLLFQTLISMHIDPPNMMAYANSNGRLDMQIRIPLENVPDTAQYPFLDQMLSAREIKRIQELGDKILSGELKEEDFLKTTFSLYVPLLMRLYGSFGNIPDNGSMDYYGHAILCKRIIEMYRIFEKGESAAKQEKEDLTHFKDELYGIYDEKREEMKKNYKNNTNHKYLTIGNRLHQ